MGLYISRDDDQEEDLQRNNHIEMGKDGLGAEEGDNEEE